MSDVSEDDVLRVIKNCKRCPVYRIAGMLGINVVKAVKILNKLEKDGKIIKEVETRSTYYKLKG